VFAGQNFSCELHTFLGVLQYSGDLDGTGPVEIVEALEEDKFLEVALLEFALVCYHSVVVGDHRSLEDTLGDQEEIVEGADYVFAHDGAGRHVDGAHLWGISVLPPAEELLVVSQVDHDDGKSDAALVDGLDVLLDELRVVLLVEVDLVFGCAVHEDHHLFGVLFVACDVGFEAVYAHLHHGCEFFLDSVVGDEG
jgi:hypothetical protein